MQPLNLNFCENSCWISLRVLNFSLTYLTPAPNLHPHSPPSPISPPSPLSFPSPLSPPSSSPLIFSLPHPLAPLPLSPPYLPLPTQYPVPKELHVVSECSLLDNSKKTKYFHNFHNRPNQELVVNTNKIFSQKSQVTSSYCLRPKKYLFPKFLATIKVIDSSHAKTSAREFNKPKRRVKWTFPNARKNYVIDAVNDDLSKKV